MSELEVGKIEVRRGFGEFHLKSLASDEFVTASGAKDGGWIVWRMVAPSRSAAPPERCPNCGRELIGTAHGTYCPNPTCKWGWEIEMDGSPLQPPIAEASAAPPSEREAAIGSDLPAFRAELEKQWMSQDVILDFRNWLVVALWNARAAAVPAPGPNQKLIDALRKIATNYGGCHCNHLTDDCCENPAVGEFCPHCISEIAIRDSGSSTPNREREALEELLEWLENDTLEIMKDTMKMAITFDQQDCQLLREHIEKAWKVLRTGATAPPKEGK